MPRNISFALTTAQFRDRSKTVTRRMGWEHLKVGDVLCGIVKGQGLKRGERVEKLGLIRVVNVRQEQLDRITDDLDYGVSDCVREGFPPPHPMSFPSEFVKYFCATHRGCHPHSYVTRIEYEYL